jgi:hypothetical protein
VEAELARARGEVGLVSQAQPRAAEEVDEPADPDRDADVEALVERPEQRTEDEMNRNVG